MSDEHLIMSRFENKINKCKNPLDLDKLCRTYLEYRGKYDNRPMDPFVESIIQANKDRPYISETFDIKKFSATMAIDAYEYRNIDKTEYVNFENNIKLQLAREMVSECIRDGFIKFGKEYDVPTMRHYFKVEMEVKKPKETR
jgi:hypothetical protein